MVRLNVQRAGAIARSKDPRKLVLAALERSFGVITHTAHELGVHRETLRLWVKRLDLYLEVDRIRRERREAKRRYLHPRSLR